MLEEPLWLPDVEFVFTELFRLPELPLVLLLLSCEPEVELPELAPVESELDPVPPWGALLLPELFRLSVLFVLEPLFRLFVSLMLPLVVLVVLLS